MKVIAKFIFKPIIYMINILMIIQLVNFIINNQNIITKHPAYLVILIGIIIISIILTDVFNHFLKQ